MWPQLGHRLPPAVRPSIDEQQSIVRVQEAPNALTALQIAVNATQMGIHELEMVQYQPAKMNKIKSTQPMRKKNAGDVPL